MSRTSLLALASLAAIAAASPLRAQVAEAPSAATIASRAAVEAFYATRNSQPLWLKDSAGREAAQKLPAILRRAKVDGLADGTELAAVVERALAGGQLADDKLISGAWVAYVQTLGAPVAGMSFGDPALAPKLPTATAVLGSAARAPSLTAHVDEVAGVNPLYSALREQAIKDGAESDPRVRATLERLRIIPAKGRAIVVDAATARLWMLEDGHAIDSMKVVVGKKKSPTPLLAGTIHYITLNPYWNIPQDVIQRRVAPVVVKRGISYLKLARYEPADGFGGKANAVPADAIDWKAVAEGSAKAYIRQLPGGNNMMGSMKFGFVNDYDIFLHDTPKDKAHQVLFAKDQRTYSMGCIRLEHADRLARWLLGRDATPESEAPEQHVPLAKGVPVYVTYLTANVEDGRLAFADDVYGLDPAPDADQPVTVADTAAR